MALQSQKTLKQLRFFMGILNHVSRFIPNLRKYTEPLRPDSKNQLIWSEEANKAFQKITELVANIPIVYHYDASKQCRIERDSSHKGLGGSLEQK